MTASQSRNGSSNGHIWPIKGGRCVNLEVQQYDPQGKDWFANTTLGCYNLSPSSEVGGSVGLTGAAGAQYRVRADFVPNEQDTNIGTDSAWFYFDVVK